MDQQNAVSCSPFLWNGSCRFLIFKLPKRDIKVDKCEVSDTKQISEIQLHLYALKSLFEFHTGSGFCTPLSDDNPLPFSALISGSFSFSSIWDKDTSTTSVLLNSCFLITQLMNKHLGFQKRKWNFYLGQLSWCFTGLLLGFKCAVIGIRHHSNHGDQNTENVAPAECVFQQKVSKC